MAKLDVTYLGLELKSPIIAGSSGLTSKVESIIELERSGVGAVVLKSLFEEQIIGDITHQNQYNDYPEAAEYLNAYIRDNHVNEYIELIKKAKSACNIPIIASICCVTGGEWVSFAKDIAESGADALELNIFFMPLSGEQSSQEVELEYLKTAKIVVDAVSIPVVVKLSNHFTNPINIARELYFRGVKGVTMFNRLYDPDININDLKLTVANIFSSSAELRNPLRWIAMSSAQQPEIEYSSSTGVHTANDAIKMLLVGASSVQICSAMYEKGADFITQINEEIDEWMKRQNFKTVDEFKGMLNYKNIEEKVAYERSQFMKYYSSYK